MSAVKTILIVFAAGTGLCCLGTVFAGLSCYRSAQSTMAEGEAYAQGALRRIGKDWSIEAMSAESSDTLRRSTSSQGAKAFLKKCHDKLGSITNVGPISVTNINTHSNFSGGSSTSIVGSLPVQCEKEAGTARVTLVKSNSAWKFQQLNIDAPGL